MISNKYCETELLGKAPTDLSNLSKFKYIDMRFFSEYIPQLGLSIGVEILYNMPNKGYYFIVMSLCPPSRLYQNKKEELKESITGTDVQTIHRLNFDSPFKAIGFEDNTKSFYITSPDLNTVVVFEIFEVKLKGTDIDKVSSIGFSCVPLLQYVEVDGRMETVEMYVNTAMIQLPIFKGPPEPEFIQNLTLK